MLALTQMLLLSVALVLVVCSVRAEDAFQNLGIFTDNTCTSFFNASTIGGVNSWSYMGGIQTVDARTVTTNTGGAPCVSDGADGVTRGQYECVAEQVGTEVQTRVTVNEWYTSATCVGASNQNFTTSTNNVTDGQCFGALYQGPNGRQNLFMKVSCGGRSNSAASTTSSFVSIASLAIIASFMI